MRSSSKGFKTSSSNNKPEISDKNTTSTSIKSGSKNKISVVQSTSRDKQKKPIESKKIERAIPKPPSNIPKIPSQKGQQAIRFPKLSKRKEESLKECKWGYLPFNYLSSIFAYACQNLFEVYQLSKVCSLWRSHMMSEGGCYFWSFLKQGQKIGSFSELKVFLQKLIVQQQQKMSFEYEKYFTKLFNYGSTKQNIPNKLIQKLNLELQICLNGKTFIQQFRLRTFNFSSYLCAKIQQIKQYKYDFYTPHNMFKDKITVDMIFRSKKFKVSHKISKKYVPEDIIDGAIKQKAFNYYLDRNFVFTYFEGDNHFLYIFFQISLLELVNIFRSIIKSKHQISLEKKTKKLPMYKQLCETEFEDFVQYVKFQADFQVHFSYHNSLKQIFTHCDTKVFPIEYDQKHAYFEVNVDDSFDKIATYKLDNKMGMSESIDDLYLLDFVLKDRDRFLIIFSGFIYARKASQKERESLQNYFQYSEQEIKIIESKQEKYSICFTIVEEGKRNLMKNVKFTLLA